MKKKYWKHGEKTAIAKEVGIRLSNLYEILYRKRGVSPERAKELEKASKKINKDIGFIEWLFNKTSKHKAFYEVYKK